MKETKRYCDFCGKELNYKNSDGECVFGTRRQIYFFRDVMSDSTKDYDICKECNNKIIKYADSLRRDHK